MIEHHFPPRRIIFPINPFGNNGTTKCIEKKVHALRALTAHEKTEIEAVYLMESETGETLDPIAAERKKSDLARTIMTQLFSPLMIETPITISVLPTRSNSPVENVDTLIRYMKERGTDLIVFSIHRGESFSKISAGYFAEILLTRCPIPMLMTTPLTPAELPSDHILLTTNFDLGATTILKSLAELVKETNHKVTLLRSLEPREIFEVRNFVNAIFSAAKRTKASFITMENRANSENPLAKTMTKQIIRGSPCPVLIFP